MKMSLSENALRDLMSPLTQANKAFANLSGETGNRQPCTCLLRRSSFKSDSAQRLARSPALSGSVCAYFFVFANAIDCPEQASYSTLLRRRVIPPLRQIRPDAPEHKPAWLAHTIYNASQKNCARPVYDFRIALRCYAIF